MATMSSCLSRLCDHSLWSPWCSLRSTSSVAAVSSYLKVCLATLHYTTVTVEYEPLGSDGMRVSLAVLVESTFRFLF